MKSADLVSLLASFGLSERMDVARFFFVNVSTAYRWLGFDKHTEKIEGFPAAVLDLMARRSKRARKPDLGAMIEERGEVAALAYFFHWCGLEVAGKKRSSAR